MDEIFLKFKKCCPNSRDQYIPTNENLIRWRWHVAQSEQNKIGIGGDPKQVIRRKARPRKFERRRAKTFNDLPPYMREQYGVIASHFPGIQVWACGSRVAGDYVEPWDDDEIRVLRDANFKQPKRQSDFDFWIEGNPTPVGNLPTWADHVRGRISENERITIEMWDFSKLPESEFDRVLFAVQSNDVRTLVEIHDRFGLSPYTYCCEMDGLLRWYTWAIDSGIIVAGKSGNDQPNNHFQLG